MAYDIKFRSRALGYWGEGHTREETAAVFKVSESTLQKWKSKLNKTGTLERKELYRTWRKIDPDKLLKYVEEHPDAFLHEIAEGFDCTAWGVKKALERLGISRKKNAGIPRKT